jgi:hypothetical protein
LKTAPIGACDPIFCAILSRPSGVPKLPGVSPKQNFEVDTGYTATGRPASINASFWSSTLMTISRGAVETEAGSVVEAHDTNPLAIKHTRKIRPP